MSNYFDHLLLLLLLLFFGAHQHKAAGLKIKLSKIRMVVIIIIDKCY